MSFPYVDIVEQIDGLLSKIAGTVRNAARRVERPPQFPSRSSALAKLRKPACLLVLATLAGCSSLPLEDVQRAPDIENNPLFYAPPIEPEYRIQVGDRLELASYFNPQLNQVVEVRPDGRISLLIIGDIYVADNTPTELDNRITQAYAREIESPEIAVIVKESANASVYVGGAVLRQSEQPIKGHKTIMQAITAAGGVLPAANTRQVLMLRKRSDNQFDTYQLDLQDILLNKAPNVYLQRTDIIYVPKTAIANAGEFVDQYIDSIIPESLRFNYSYNRIRYNNRGATIDVSP